MVLVGGLANREYCFLNKMFSDRFSNLFLVAVTLRARSHKEDNETSKKMFLYKDKDNRNAEIGGRARDRRSATVGGFACTRTHERPRAMAGGICTRNRVPTNEGTYKSVRIGEQAWGRPRGNAVACKTRE